MLAAESAGIRADNRAFRYGYGLFETMLIRDGNIRLGEYHWKRLFNGMEALLIHAPKYFREELEREVKRTAAKNKLDDYCRVRLQVSAGHGGLYDSDRFAGEYVIEIFPLEPHISELNEAGLVLGIAEPVKHRDKYAWIKASAALPYALAARQAKEAQWNDALLLNEQGNIVESTIANVFWIIDGIIYTPPLSEGCVAGVMRRHLLTLLPGLGYQVKELPFTIGHLEQAEGMFLTNAIRGIKWVRTVNQIDYQPTLIKDLYTKVVVSL